MRKIINNPEHVVDEMMEGYISAYSRYYVKHPDVNGVILKQRRKDKVALVKRTILKVAEQVYVLADSSKFGGGYVSVICPIQDVYKIITDSDVSRENIKKAQESNISLVIA